MSEIKTIKGKVDFLIVPESDIRFPIKDLIGSKITLIDNRKKYVFSKDDMFRLSTITEEQASLLVDRYFDKYNAYKNYTSTSVVGNWSCETAKESLFSLLRANKVVLEHGVSAFIGENEYDAIKQTDYLLIIKND